MNELKDRVTRDQRRRFRLNLFQRNRVHLLELIDHSKLEKEASFKPLEVSKASKVQSTSNLIQFEEIDNDKLKSLEYSSKDVRQLSSLEIKKQDLIILLNDLYREEQNENLLTQTIKLTNVLIIEEQEGRLGLLKEDVEFWVQLKDQILKSSLLEFLSQPFQKNRVVLNQLKCLFSLSSLIDFGKFLAKNGFLARRLINNLFVEYNKEDYLSLKLKIFSNLGVNILQDNLCFISNVSLKLIKKWLSQALNSSFIPAFDMYASSARILKQILLLIDKVYFPSGMKDSVNSCFSDVTECESSFLDKEKSFLPLLVETSILIVKFIQMSIEEYSEEFTAFLQIPANKSSPLRITFALIYKLTEMHSNINNRVDLSPFLVEYLNLLGSLQISQTYFDDHLKDFTLMLNSLIGSTSQVKENLKFDFELFYLEHGFKLFTFIKKKFLKSDKREITTVFIWFFLNLLRMDQNYMYQNLLDDSTILARLFAVISWDFDELIDDFVSCFLFNYIQRASLGESCFNIFYEI